MIDPIAHENSTSVNAVSSAHSKVPNGQEVQPAGLDQFPEHFPNLDTKAFNHLRDHYHDLHNDITRIIGNESGIVNIYAGDTLVATGRFSNVSAYEVKYNASIGLGGKSAGGIIRAKFNGLLIEDVHFEHAVEADFVKARLNRVTFGKAGGSNFSYAHLNDVTFGEI